MLTRRFLSYIRLSQACEAENWHRASIGELIAIADYTGDPFVFDKQNFPNVQAGFYLSSTPDGDNKFWAINSVDGSLDSFDPWTDGELLVMYIAGDPGSRARTFFLDTANVVHDNNGQQWPLCPHGLQGMECEAGEAVLMTFAEASSMADGKDDWRLPTINELLSIADFDGTGNFPYQPDQAEVYWAVAGDDIWMVELPGGSANLSQDPNSRAAVRLIR